MKSNTETNERQKSPAWNDPDARLLQLRETFVDDCLSGMFWLTLCILVMSAWRNFLGPEKLRLVVPFALIAFTSTSLAIASIFRAHLGYKMKSITLLIVLFVIGTGGIVSFGTAATGNYFTMAFFIAAILFRRSVVFGMIAGVAIIIGTIAFGFISGVFDIPHNLREIGMQPVAWINIGLTMSISGGAIAVSGSSFIRSVYQLLNELHQQQIEIRKQRDQIHYLATHDNLTGLPTLQLLNDKGHMALELARRSGDLVAYLFIDLDDFKLINDTYGHDAGDCVLKEVARRILSCIRASDMAARIGGDEFVVMLTGITDAQSAGKVADNIIRMIVTPINYNTTRLKVGGSIGISIFSVHADDLNGLKQAADKAMYAAKALGKNQYIFANGDLLSANEQMQ